MTISNDTFFVLLCNGVRCGIVDCDDYTITRMRGRELFKYTDIVHGIMVKNGTWGGRTVGVE